MKLHLTKIFVLLLLVVSSVGCKKKNDQVDFHLDYFPTNKGRFVIYQVQDININSTVGQYDTTNVFIKAIIGDTLTDNQGRIVNRYERWYGPTANGPWTLVDIWTTVVDDNRAELVEENNRTIKMVFAPTEYKEWNANAYNTQESQDCYYSELHVPFTIGGNNFDSTVTVLQEYQAPNFLEYKNKYERYAKGVGMIQKVYIDQTHSNGNVNQIIQGRKLYMDLVSYGQE